MLQVPLWRRLLRRNFNSSQTLGDFLELTDQQQAQLFHDKNFPLNVPLRLAQKMFKRDLTDPLLLQFVPLQIETLSMDQGSKDPLEEAEFRPAPKLLHKYPGRVLLLPTSACAMHCRYCFRRHFDYHPVSQERYDFSQELAYIQKDPTIHEVLLSGGDPLSLDTPVLADLLEKLEAIPHLTRVRFHTRFLIGIPERVDMDLLQLFQQTRLRVWFVIHINHARELDSDILRSLDSLKRVGVTLLTQTVLLKGVNDDLTTLKELYELLIDHGVVPYYLHQLDRVSGALHFDVEEETGRRLIGELEKVLPGYAVPRYVREIPGKPNKTSLLNTPSSCH